MSDALRRRLLDATLPHVPFDGWSERALGAGAHDAAVEWPAARRAFPGGMDDMLALWNTEADRRMVEALAGQDLGALRIRDRIATCVRLRLKPLANHREAVRLALTHAALPANAPGALRALWRTVDAMWHAAGDTSTDFNFYSKRGLLAGVYSTTLLYWLDDTSEDFSETWAFLDRRIADVLKVPKATARLKRLLPNPDRLFRAFAIRRAARG
ncbi:MAG: COQ9 family protein [Alphaproteobacteria bacterium]